MYIAEIHGKLSRQQENQEDILTSNVFSFFKYANRQVFLYRFLGELGIIVTAQEAAQAEFFFWPHLDDGTEPDLIILVGDYYLLIECKYLSGFSQETAKSAHQVAREIEHGQLQADNLKKIFRILAVTAHYSFSKTNIDGLPEQYHSQLKWISWQQIALFIYNHMSDMQLSEETKQFAQDLYHLLVRKNLRLYEGASVLAGLPGKVHRHNSTIFFNAKTARFRGAFVGFRSTLAQVHPVSNRSKQIFFKRPINE